MQSVPASVETSRSHSGSAIARVGVMTDHQRETYAAAGIIALLVALCALASLSGCLTPAKLAEMAQRADTLSKGAKTDECADAAANAASDIVRALEDMTRATRLSDPMRSPKPALRLAEVACIECVHNRDCPDARMW